MLGIINHQVCQPLTGDVFGQAYTNQQYDAAGVRVPPEVRLIPRVELDLSICGKLINIASVRKNQLG